jgi:lipopolysaccharide export system protein LptC
MAEIPIERKPRRQVAPLLLILLVIVLLGAGWYWWSHNKNRTATMTTSAAPLVQTASTSVPTEHSFLFRRV